MEFPLVLSEVLYYVAVFVVAFLAGISQTLRDNTWGSFWNGLSVGLCSGFLAFAIVSFLDRPPGSRAGHEFYYLGIAALVGLSGKFQDRIIQALWSKLGKALGVENEMRNAIDKDDKK
jgi:hypothetical protein